MEKETKKYLRNRWDNPEFINSFPFPFSYDMDTSLLNNIDLRGIKKLGCGEPFWKFPNIVSANLYNIDLSFGDGALSVHESEIENLNCIDFKFDRSSRIYKSTIKNSCFIKAKLILDITDTTFENCDFSQSTFKGGFKEYGFRRCKFINCKFDAAQWQNTYMLACWFIDCDFTNFIIRNSSIKGFKVNKLPESIYNIFENCEVSGLIETNFD